MGATRIKNKRKCLTAIVPEVIMKIVFNNRNQTRLENNDKEDKGTISVTGLIVIGFMKTENVCLPWNVPSRRSLLLFFVIMR